MTTEKSPWIYRGKVVTPDMVPEDAVGFVYCITFLKAVDPECGHYYHKPYIGKKQLTSSKRSRIGVREKAATKTRKTFKTTVKSSGWEKYWGSCKELKEDVLKYGEEQFERTILEWCWSKKYMSYVEMQNQVTNNVLLDDTYNGNILNRWFRKDMIKPEKK